MDERIFHLAAPRTWPRDGRPHEPASLRSEGFLHASSPSQLANTLSFHFDPERDETPLSKDSRWNPPLLASTDVGDVPQGASGAP